MSKATASCVGVHEWSS